MRCEARIRSIATSESCRLQFRKLERCDWPKPVWRASSETLRVPLCILRSSSRRRRSCICVIFICGKSATSNSLGTSPVSHGKAKRADWPSFSRPCLSFGRASPENLPGRLTQEIHIPRLALLILHWLVGIFWETAHCQMVERPDSTHASRSETSPQACRGLRYSPLPVRKTLSRSVRAGQCGNSRICAP